MKWVLRQERCSGGSLKVPPGATSIYLPATLPRKTSNQPFHLLSYSTLISNRIQFRSATSFRQTTSYPRRAQLSIAIIWILPHRDSSPDPDPAAAEATQSNARKDAVVNLYGYRSRPPHGAKNSYLRTPRTLATSSRAVLVNALVFPGGSLVAYLGTPITTST